jgi:hypothetical protein
MAEDKIQPEAPAGKGETKPSKQTRKKAQPKATEFPAIARINEYGFLHFGKRWLEELGWIKGMELKVDRATDVGLILRKA